MLSYKKLIFSLFITICAPLFAITPQPYPFSLWKAACNVCMGTKKSPLTQESFITELNAFVESHNNGPLSDQNNWIKTDGSGKQMPSPEFYTATKFEPYVQKLEVPQGAEIAFHGDVHGDIQSFNVFIQDLANKGYMDPTDPFKIKRENFYIIMLGDYTDRGEYGAEVLYAIMRLKQTNPDTFFMVRGNHEDVQLNAHYGLFAELCKKFTDPSTIMEAIHRTYNYLPVALYLKSGNNALQCCHGGMEVGFSHTRQLLDASESKQFILLGDLQRQTCVHSLSTLAQQAFASVHLADITQYAPNSIGFLWNDFTFAPENDSREYAEVQAIRGRGYEYPQKITQHLLKHVSTSTCALRGVFRAHQHAPDTMPYILNRNRHTHQENTGVAKLWPPQDHIKQPAQKLWDGIVCTFCISPNNTFGTHYHYNFDTYGILKTAQKFDDWRLEVNRLMTKQ